MSKQQINPAYELYCIRYNVMYHDYDLSESEIEMRLGNEPQKYLDPPLDEVAESPYEMSMVENFRMQQKHGSDYDGRELVDQEPPFDGWQ